MEVGGSGYYLVIWVMLSRDDPWAVDGGYCGAGHPFFKVICQRCRATDHSSVVLPAVNIPESVCPHI